MGHREEYELSSIEKIMGKLQPFCNDIYNELVEVKDSYDMISLEKLRSLLLKFVELEFQEFITIHRKLTKIRKTKVHLSKILKLMNEYCLESFEMPGKSEDSNR